jgi:hypothetical protein
MTLKPVRTAAECAASMEASDQKLRARIVAERQKQALKDDARWRQDFDRKARELFADKAAQSRLDMASANSGTRSTYSVLSELARAGVA